MFLTLSEGIFFSTIGVIFFLVVSMFYHFKRKMEALEKNNENLGTICKTIVKELEHTKQMQYEQQQQQQQQMPKYSPPELTKEVLMNNASYEIKEEDTESEYSTDEESEAESEAESDEEPEIIYEGGNKTEEVHHSESSDLIDKSETLEKDIIVEKLDIEEVMSDSIHQLSDHSEVEIVIEDSIVEIEVMDAADDADVEADDLENKSISDPYTRNQLKKMTIQMLKTIMVQNQWEYDDSMKKNELIESILGYSETA